MVYAKYASAFVVVSVYVSLSTKNFVSSKDTAVAPCVYCGVVPAQVNSPSIKDSLFRKSLLVFLTGNRPVLFINYIDYRTSAAHFDIASYLLRHKF